MTACDRLGVPFDRRSPGTLLIPRSGVERVLRDVIAQGFEVLGLEGFELEGPIIHPRLDLIFDRDRSRVTALDALARFDDAVWVDVVLAQPHDIHQR